MMQIFLMILELNADSSIVSNCDADSDTLIESYSYGQVILFPSLILVVLVAAALLVIIHY